MVTQVEAGQARCPAEAEWADAQAVAACLGFPIRRVNFEKEYWHGVFDVMLDAYAAGATPNPDVLCNREIKFGALKVWIAIGVPVGVGVVRWLVRAVTTFFSSLCFFGATATGPRSGSAWGNDASHRPLRASHRRASLRRC